MCVYVCIWCMHVCVCVVRVHVCRHTEAIVWVMHVWVSMGVGIHGWGVFFYLFILLSDTVSHQTWSSLIGYTGWPVTPGGCPYSPLPALLPLAAFPWVLWIQSRPHASVAGIFLTELSLRTHYHFLSNRQLLFY